MFSGRRQVVCCEFRFASVGKLIDLLQLRLRRGRTMLSYCECLARLPNSLTVNI